MEYPKYMYVSAENEAGFEAKLLFSREQELALGECFDSPSKVPAKKRVVRSPLFEKTVEELKSMLVEKGVAKKDLKGKREADLVAMLEEMA